MHPDVQTVAGPGLGAYTTEPMLVDGRLTWRDGPTESLDLEVLRPVDDPFDKDGGLRMLAGNLGRAVIKTSAVVPEQRLVEAPARVFGDQSEFQAAFEAGELSDDLVAVVRYQGPKANGMPELHKLITPLGVLQDRGHRVALVTDGRMSGASGKIPAAIHVTPEAAADASPIARVRDGDLVRLDADAGTIEVLVDHAEFAARPAAAPPERPFVGTGRELFESFRRAVGPADAGASIFGDAA
jgi:phosphogluconate dehydratase